MSSGSPQNPLYYRYATREMTRVFSPAHRFGQWRRLWTILAECEKELGIAISEEELASLRKAAGEIDLERVAELERETRHDVVAHLRHFAERAGAGGRILHLGATSAFLTDNTDALLTREALELIARRLARVIHGLGEFARRTRAVPTLAYTHLQPAQLTTVGKRACLWIQDLAVDLEEVRGRLQRLRCRGAKGTTGTQASFLTLFGGDKRKVKALDRCVTQSLGFTASWPVTGQTYPRKQDSQVLATLAGIAESCHRLGTDLRLLQGLGELSEPFDPDQVGSSAMPYKRNPVRSERMCGLARRLITDSLNGPLNAATQWLERSLDDSANRRLVLADSFLCADAILNIAAGIAQGLVVHEERIRSRVTQELPFMVTETLLTEGTAQGGDRQQLHEQIRRHSVEAHAAVARGEKNPLVDLIAADPAIGWGRDEIEARMDPRAFTGRSAEQVGEFLATIVEPLLEEVELAPMEEPRI